jgi:uncharacterized phage-associated protein
LEHFNEIKTLKPVKCILVGFLIDDSCIFSKIKIARRDNMLSVFDVASYILKKIGWMTTMKLQKLVYYSQAWALVWDEEPLFNEDVEAWSNGPVVRELFEHLRGEYQISSISKGDHRKINKTQKRTIDAVLKYYGDKPAQWLIDLTHEEPPWNEARKGLGPTDRGDHVMTLDSIAEYYSSL